MIFPHICFFGSVESIHDGSTGVSFAETADPATAVAGVALAAARTGWFAPFFEGFALIGPHREKNSAGCKPCCVTPEQEFPARGLFLRLGVLAWLGVSLLTESIELLGAAAPGRRGLGR